MQAEPAHDTGLGESLDAVYEQHQAIWQYKVLVLDLARVYGLTQPFNVANGKDNTILQLVDCLNKIIGKNIKPIFLAKRPGDVFKTHASLSNAKKRLGFKPKIDFIKGLKLTVEYF